MIIIYNGGILKIQMAGTDQGGKGKPGPDINMIQNLPPKCPILKANNLPRLLPFYIGVSNFQRGTPRLHDAT